jgi:hypothetical protein
MVYAYAVLIFLLIFVVALFIVDHKAGTAIAMIEKLVVWESKIEIIDSMGTPAIKIGEEVWSGHTIFDSITRAYSNRRLRKEIK